jgi:hypothetical protein
VTLEELADRMEILDLYARYVNYVDSANIAALDEQIFLPGTTFDYSDANGPVLNWQDAQATKFFEGGGFAHYFHISVNQVIEFDDERALANVISKTFNPWARTNTAGAARTFQVHGRYHDKLVHTDAGWRFESRRWEDAWCGAWLDGEFRLTDGISDMLL